MDQSTRRTVAQNVKRFRLAAGWKQEDLGSRADLAQTTISSVENENGKSPTLTILDSIAGALGIPTWTLMVETDLMDKEQLKSLDAVVQSYTKLPATGQHQIDRVAEAETRYARAS
jgi:transcriptional regulator with XRE-family HTH domain